jgi:hypothetical protein
MLNIGSFLVLAALVLEGQNRAGDAGLSHKKPAGATGSTLKEAIPFSNAARQLTNQQSDDAAQDWR